MNTNDPEKWIGDRSEQWFQIKDDSAETCFHIFRDTSTPKIIQELKRQVYKSRKGRTSFGAMMHLIKVDEYRMAGEIDVEIPDPILHQEIKIHNLAVQEVGLITIEDHIHRAFEEVLNELNERRAALIIQVTAGTITGQIDRIMVASRRIFRLINTDHIIQVAAAIYPLALPRTKHIVDAFFRCSPPNDPAKS